MGLRTDMAVEAHELSRGDLKEISGVKVTTSTNENITRTVVDVVDDKGAGIIGKEIGRYITIDVPQIKYSTHDYELAVKMITDELCALSEGKENILVVGLGNDDITPDALGSETVKKLIITTHMKKHMPDALSPDFGSVAAIIPGVMGDTGIETFEIVKGVTEKLAPDLIIAIDSLAGADINRITTSIQIADTGISPGSGVGNHRNGLNYDSLGVKVIAIGVPTVIAAELLSGGEIDDEYKSLMVTTKDIDYVIKRMSKTIANGINMAFHRNLDLKAIDELVG